MGRADDAPEALSLIEFDSIALGTKAVDALLKKAPVRMERLGTLQPGKLATLFSGDVASVEASHAEALRVGGDALIDEILLPRAEPRVYAAIFGEVPAFDGDTLGMVETSTMAAAVLAADVMVKGTLVGVVSLRLGDELGGKGLVHLVGEQHDVEAALALAEERASGVGRRLLTSITPRLDDDLRGWLSRSTRFWEAPC